MTLKQLIAKAGSTQAEVARRSGISAPNLNNITKNRLPRQWLHGVRHNVKAALLEVGAGTLSETEIEETLCAIENKRARTGKARQGKAAQHQSGQNTTEEQTMIMRKQRLNPEAKAYFKLVRNPFDEPNSIEGVFHSDGIRFVRESLLDAARNGNFLAIIGESGSGKTTIHRSSVEYLKKHHPEIVVIEPYIVGMTSPDKGGKALTARDIAESIFKAVAESHESIPGSSELLYSRVHTFLRDSHDAKRRHLVIINEAHDLHTLTLKSLKRFWEMSEGMTRLLSIVLIGQTELEQRLNGTSKELREVTQRCDVVKFPPLRHDLRAYLEHIFAQVKKPLDDVFTPEAVEAMREVLFIAQDKTGRGKDMTYPLAVNNLAAAAMNFTSACGEEKVTADAVREAVNG